MRLTPYLSTVLKTLAASLLLAGAAHAQMLIGWAEMPAATFSNGPTSGQFAAPNLFGTNLPPYVNRQPVQGFSGVLAGPRDDVYHFLVDNGFGAQNNSADAVLRAYTLEINWRSRRGGVGTVNPAEWDSGRERSAFDARTRLELNDERRKLTVPIQADYANYYRETYTGRRFIYPLDVNGTNIGDMVAVDDRRFVVLERNGNTATAPTPAPFKKVYLIDIEDVAEGGVARKMELVDLMKLADPFDLNGDGSQIFTFPYTTIENLLIIDPRTLLVVNDNNFPGGGGRELASDNTEFLRIRLPVSLIVDTRGNHDHGHDHDED